MTFLDFVTCPKNICYETTFKILTIVSCVSSLFRNIVMNHQASTFILLLLWLYHEAPSMYGFPDLIIFRLCWPNFESSIFVASFFHDQRQLRILPPEFLYLLKILGFILLRFFLLIRPPPKRAFLGKMILTTTIFVIISIITHKLFLLFLVTILWVL